MNQFVVRPRFVGSYLIVEDISLGVIILSLRRIKLMKHDKDLAIIAPQVVLRILEVVVNSHSLMQIEMSLHFVKNASHDNWHKFTTSVSLVRLTFNHGKVAHDHPPTRVRKITGDCRL